MARSSSSTNPSNELSIDTWQQAASAPVYSSSAPVKPIIDFPNTIPVFLFIACIASYRSLLCASDLFLNQRWNDRTLAWQEMFATSVHFSHSVVTCPQLAPRLQSDRWSTRSRFISWLALIGLCLKDADARKLKLKLWSWWYTTGFEGGQNERIANQLRSLHRLHMFNCRQNWTPTCDWNKANWHLDLLSSKLNRSRMQDAAGKIPGAVFHCFSLSQSLEFIRGPALISTILFLPIPLEVWSQRIKKKTLGT